jgi:DNA helicase-2/ATP-dependent DNA helicase PcrA
MAEKPDLEADEKNPMFAAMEDRREWPPTGRVGADDELFPEGWGAAADAVVAGKTTIEQLISKSGSAEHPETGFSAETPSRDLGEKGVSAETLIAEHMADLEVIAAAIEPEAPAEPQIPDIISATSYVALQNGDITAWDLIRPLPQRPTFARRLGTEVHRIIEERNRGISPFADETELDEPGEYTEPSKIGEMLARFEELGYADRPIAKLPSGEPMVELPFVMKTEDGRIIRGRIDAVYETEDGGLEIVDWKTGRAFRQEEEDQLSIYQQAIDRTVPHPYAVTTLYTFLDID